MRLLLLACLLALTACVPDPYPEAPPLQATCPVPEVTCPPVPPYQERVFEEIWIDVIRMRETCAEALDVTLDTLKVCNR